MESGSGSSGPGSGETDFDDEELRVDDSGPGSVDSSGHLEADGELDD